MEQSPADYVKENTWLADPENGEKIMQIVRKYLLLPKYPVSSRTILLSHDLTWLCMESAGVNLLCSLMRGHHFLSHNQYGFSFLMDWICSYVKKLPSDKSKWRLFVKRQFVSKGLWWSMWRTDLRCCPPNWSLANVKDFFFPRRHFYSDLSKCGRVCGITSHLPDIFNSCCFYHITPSHLAVGVSFINTSK